MDTSFLSLSLKKHFNWTFEKNLHGISLCKSGPQLYTFSCNMWFVLESCLMFPTSAAWLANGRSPRKSELPFNIRLPFTNIKSRCLTEAPVFDNPMQKRKKYDFSLPEEPTLIYQPTQSTKILSEPASRWKKKQPTDEDHSISRKIQCRFYHNFRPTKNKTKSKLN